MNLVQTPRTRFNYISFSFDKIYFPLDLESLTGSQTKYTHDRYSSVKAHDFELFIDEMT